MIGCLVFRIIFAFVFEGSDFRDGFHEICDLRIEFGGQFFFRDAGIFNRIVQEACGNGLRSAFQRGQDVGYIIQMNGIRFAAAPELASMVFCRIVCRMLDQRQILRFMNILPRFLQHVADACILDFCH